jgi:thiol-disulfide isomerase/thioredoxin
VSQPELIVFEADWCAVCQGIKEQVSQIEKSGVKVTRIDGDTNPQLVSEYEVTSYPTMFIKLDGRVKLRSQDIDEVLKWLKNPL